MTSPDASLSSRPSRSSSRSLASRRYPGLAILVPGKMPGAAHRRGKPDLPVRRMPVQQILAARLGLDRQDAVHELDIQLPLGTLDRGLQPRQASYRRGSRTGWSPWMSASWPILQIPKPASRAWQGCGKLRQIGGLLLWTSSHRIVIFRRHFFPSGFGGFLAFPWFESRIWLRLVSLRSPWRACCWPRRLPSPRRRPPPPPRPGARHTRLQAQRPAEAADRFAREVRRLHAADAP